MQESFEVMNDVQRVRNWTRDHSPILTLFWKHYESSTSFVFLGLGIFDTI